MERTGIRYVPLLEKGDRFESKKIYSLTLNLNLNLVHWHDICLSRRSISGHDAEW